MNPRSKSERPLKERLREAVREEILAGAQRVFSARGLGAAKMEEIALAAGVSVGTLYNHFEDREALLQALLDEKRERSRARLDEVLERTRSAPFREQLTEFLRATLENFIEHRALFTMLVEDEMRGGKGRLRSQAALKEINARYEQLLDRGLEQGALRPQDSALYTPLLLGFVRGLFMQFTLDETLTLSPELVESMVRIFLEGAGTRT